MDEAQKSVLKALHASLKLASIVGLLDELPNGVQDQITILNFVDLVSRAYGEKPENPQ